jgi:hypothetical protein
MRQRCYFLESLVATFAHVQPGPQVHSGEHAHAPALEEPPLQLQLGPHTLHAHVCGFAIFFSPILVALAILHP